MCVTFNIVKFHDKKKIHLKNFKKSCIVITYFLISNRVLSFFLKPSDSKPTLIKTLFDNGLPETPTTGETLSWELMSNYDRVSIVSYLHISNTKGSYKSLIKYNHT